MPSKSIEEAYKALKTLYEAKKTEYGGTIPFDDFYPIDLTLLTRLLGWKVERVSIVGYLELTEPVDAQSDFQNKVITLTVGDHTILRRINFTLAHEIGHIMLHGKKGKQALLRARALREKRIGNPQPYARYEVEADRFAAELLMPQKAVRRRFEEVFGCTEIIPGYAQARRIIEMHPKGADSLKVDRRLLGEIIATYAVDQGYRSMVDFFDVSIKAMVKRLTELRILLF